MTSQSHSNAVLNGNKTSQPLSNEARNYPSNSQQLDQQLNSTRPVYQELTILHSANRDDNSSTLIPVNDNLTHASTSNKSLSIFNSNFLSQTSASTENFDSLTEEIDNTILTSSNVQSFVETTTLDSLSNLNSTSISNKKRHKRKNRPKILTRKRKIEKNLWIDVAAKRARNTGTEGIGRKGEVIEAKKIKEGCRSCRFKCSIKISLEDRE